MDMIFKCFSLILLAELINCQIIDITCNYSFDNYINENKIQTCSVITSLRIHNEGQEINIMNIERSKMVKAFVAKNKEIFYIPNGIDKSIPELKYLVIQHSKLKKISANNLQNLTKLEYLDLSNNEIEVLEANVFRIEIPLKTILLNDNKIKSVGSTAFKESYMYEYLDFSDNICISGWGKILENRTALITRIYANCSNGDAHNDTYSNDSSEVYSFNIENTILLTLGVIFLIAFTLIIICLSCKKLCAKKPNKFHSNKVYSLTVLSNMNNDDTIRPQNPYECQEMYEEMNYELSNQEELEEPVDNDFYSERLDSISQNSIENNKAIIYATV